MIDVEIRKSDPWGVEDFMETTSQIAPLVLIALALLRKPAPNNVNANGPVNITQITQVTKNARPRARARV